MQFSAVPPDEAAQTLATVRAAREATEGRLGAFWFPLVVVGVLLFVSSWFFHVWAGGAVALFWLVAAPFAMYAVKRYQHIQLRASGAVQSGRPYLLLTASFIASCVVLGAIGGVTGEPDLINYGPLFGIAAVCAARAWRDRSVRYAAWAVGIATFALATIFAFGGIDDPARIFALAIGANLVIEGFGERNRRGA